MAHYFVVFTLVLFSIQCYLENIFFLSKLGSKCSGDCKVFILRYFIVWVGVTSTLIYIPLIIIWFWSCVNLKLLEVINVLCLLKLLIYNPANKWWELWERSALGCYLNWCNIPYSPNCFFLFTRKCGETETENI